MQKEALALFLTALLGVGALTSQLPQTPYLLASVDSDEGAENEQQEQESNDDSTEEGGSDTGEEDNVEPDIPKIDEPVTEPITEPDLPLVPLTEPEPEITECPEGYFLSDIDKCEPLSLTELGELVGPPEECPPELGLTPLECLEKVVEAPIPKIELPLEENQTDPSLPPSPSPEVNVTLPEEPIDPIDNSTDPGDNSTDPGDNDNSTIIINIKTIIKNIENIHKSGGSGKNNFPDIDIIGLSTKQNGDSIMCLMNIKNSWVQCQEFGMDSQRVNGDFWRIIETDSSKNYDNGNTGSDDINDAIDDIKSHDFSELNDADNHDFKVDLGWVAINPQGDGVTCVTTDQSGKGKSLCEPFKVSNQDVDGQITEGFQFED